MDLQQVSAGAARILEAAGVGTILLGSVVATAIAGWRLRKGAATAAFTALRQRLGRAILLGLEFLVAADIIRTVHDRPSLDQVAVLGAVVLIRTFLSFTLHAELEGHWPWQQTAVSRADRGGAGSPPPPRDAGPADRG